MRLGFWMIAAHIPFQDVDKKGRKERKKEGVFFLQLHLALPVQEAPKIYKLKLSTLAPRGGSIGLNTQQKKNDIYKLNYCHRVRSNSGSKPKPCFMVGGTIFTLLFLITTFVQVVYT